MKPKTFLTVALILIVVACKRVPTEITTQESVLAVTSTFAPVSTKTPYPSPTFASTVTVAPTNTPKAETLDFKGIKSGQYVLVEDFETAKPYLYIISTDKQIVKKISLEGINTLNTNFAVSNDGTQFLIMRPGPKLSYLLDISTSEQTSLLIKQMCLSASWSPDKQFIAISCLTNDSGMEIFVLDRASGQVSQVTECHNNYKYCYSANWSTNGHWLAYYQSDERSGEHPRGIMIFNTNCFSNNNCMNELMGPIKADSNPAWSLQNQLVFMQSGMISYIELKNRQINQVRANLVPNLNGGGRSSEVIKFSPDGNYLACISINRDSVYLYSPTSNNSEKLFSIQDYKWLSLIGWVTIQ